jgi:peptidase E
MSEHIKPIYLFSDSQLLFRKDEGQLFLDSVRSVLQTETPKAAYVGASNGDDPEFYGIFEAAMAGIGIQDCRHISASLPEEDISFVNQADLILLAGGEVEKGWQVFEENGLKETIPRRYYEGSLLIGISAGAVQLGWYGWPEGKLSANTIFDTFKLVPFIVSAHDEGREWESLKDAVEISRGIVRGIGIPAGGGLIFHVDQTVEPIRHPLFEVVRQDDKIGHSLVFPGSYETRGEVGLAEWIN